MRACTIIAARAIMLDGTARTPAWFAKVATHAASVSIPTAFPRTAEQPVGVG